MATTTTSAWPPWPARPTGSRWPRPTCACGARARCWAPVRRGRATCKLASLSDEGDIALLGEAKKAAETIVDADPQLAEHESLREEVGLLLSEDEGEYLFKS